MVTNTINYTYLKGYILKLNQHVHMFTFFSPFSSIVIGILPFDLSLCFLNRVESVMMLEEKVTRSKKTMNFKGNQQKPHVIPRNKSMFQAEKRKNFKEYKSRRHYSQPKMSQQKE